MHTEANTTVSSRPHLLIGFNVPDEVIESVNALLDCEGELMVLRA